MKRQGRQGRQEVIVDQSREHQSTSCSIRGRPGDGWDTADRQKTVARSRYQAARTGRLRFAKGKRGSGVLYSWRQGI